MHVCAAFSLRGHAVRAGGREGCAFISAGVRAHLPRAARARSLLHVHCNRSRFLSLALNLRRAAKPYTKY